MVAGVAAEGIPDRSYRVDIDGLRAISILFVVAFHAGLTQFAGGYVGVDVFFVLSGYLITGLLVAEFQRNGRISLREFYARRIRRLLPLAAVVLGATMVAGLWLLPPLSRESLLHDVRASALYFANWRFAGQATAYSDAEVTDSLLLHYWSLSVEEQFYVLWPVLIVIVSWFAMRRHRVRLVPLLGVVLGLGIALSFLASVVLTPDRGPEAYYASHTRFWEMGVGAGLALVLPHVGRLPRWAAEAGGVLGLGAIVTSAMLYSAATAFPGWSAVLPVAGASLMIATAAHQDTLTARVMRSGPLPYIGRVSYGWYLWHWPAIGVALLLNSRHGAPLPNWLVTLLAVGVSFMLAAASHVVLENPLRHATWLVSSRPRSYALGVVATGLPVAVVVLFQVYGNIGGTVPEAVAIDGASEGVVEFTMSPQEASNDGITVGPDGCHIAQDDPAPNFECVAGHPDGATTVALLGDSHARHWLPALDRAGRERGWRVFSLTKSACTPIDVKIWNSSFGREYIECEEWRTLLFDELEARGDIDLVIVSKSFAYSASVLQEDGERADADAVPDLWGSGAARTFARLGDASEHVVVLRDTPWAEEDVPTCFSQSPTDPSACDISLDERAGLDEELSMAEQRVAPEDVHFIDPTPLVCPRDPCSMVTESGVIKYSDRHHLTQTFSRSLGPELGEMLEETLAGPR